MNFTNIIFALSEERLQPFLSECDEDEKRAVALYERNLMLSQALYAPLHCLEITLRNRIDQTLRRHLAENWLLSIELENHYHQHRQRTLESLKRAGRPETNSRVLSEMSFGFWVHMLSGTQNSLWLDTLHKGFPGHQRKPMHKDVDRLRKLRNRIMHHEPILDRNLHEDFLIILRLVRAICPDTAEWLVRNALLPQAPLQFDAA